mmetsp:Transcript_20999/g.31821  ORF Transcript_20999/g.31821 Transcript_20999/m.31821 type:complete len:104 (-) Transcript_20999:432-743(-)|eukprot:CAMPEP_0196137634 /NCGR_PEP_ID=MMETSP0910-20130528/5557_1 /TAXON_ID=49265 /ORGANISM="Thalassiosira rotula, Strain GSO102" /LENGTH=103 /DNA_ID=CAMNT_0041398119 /DNA_START=33 /DNA_END=344 /DNA_ORIENTATION=-
MASPLLRYQLFLSIGIVFLAIWKGSLSNIDSIKSSHPIFESSTIIEPLVTYLPVWAILSLGVYALFSVLYRVATFGDCPEAADELGKQIIEAKEKLKAAGFAF